MSRQTEESSANKTSSRTRSLANIANDASALRQPAPSLYAACLRERLELRQNQLAELDSTLDEIRTEGFAAAVRLLTLDSSQRVMFSAYTDLLNKEGA